MRTKRNQINTEAFMPPVGLVKVGTYYGGDIYSSSKLQEQFVDAIKKQKILSPVWQSIDSLVKSGIIIPGYISKNYLQFLGKKFFSDPRQSGVLGLYVPEKKKIYCLLDNKATWFAIVENQFLSMVLMHELQHFCADKLRHTYLKLFRSDLRIFYTTFYNAYFGAELPPKDIDKIIDFVFNNFEIIVTQNPLEKMYNLLHQVSKPYIIDEVDRHDKIIKLLASVKVYLTNHEQFVKYVYAGGTARQISIALFKAYRALGSRNPKTMAIQEVIFPSEVICIQSEFDLNSKHYKAIQLASR